MNLLVSLYRRPWLAALVSLVGVSTFGYLGWAASPDYRALSGEPVSLTPAAAMTLEGDVRRLVTLEGARALCGGTLVHEDLAHVPLTDVQGNWRAVATFRKAEFSCQAAAARPLTGLLRWMDKDLQRAVAAAGLDLADTPPGKSVLELCTYCRKEDTAGRTYFFVIMALLMGAFFPVWMVLIRTRYVQRRMATDGAPPSQG